MHTSHWVTSRHLGLIATAGALGLALSGASGVAIADHGFPHVEILGNGSFVEKVSASFKVKGFPGGTQVLKMKDASDMYVLRVTIEPGGIGPWHTHTGTGILINTGPGIITSVVGDDCEPRFYMPNDAFVDPGDGELHAVRNDSEQEVQLMIIFFGVEGGPVSPVPGGPDECDFLP